MTWEYLAAGLKWRVSTISEVYKTKRNAWRFTLSLGILGSAPSTGSNPGNFADTTAVLKHQNGNDVCQRRLESAVQDTWFRPGMNISLPQANAGMGHIPIWAHDCGSEWLGVFDRSNTPVSDGNVISMSPTVWRWGRALYASISVFYNVHWCFQGTLCIHQIAASRVRYNQDHFERGPENTHQMLTPPCFTGAPCIWTVHGFL